MLQASGKRWKKFKLCAKTNDYCGLQSETISELWKENCGTEKARTQAKKF